MPTARRPAKRTTTTKRTHKATPKRTNGKRRK
jgi:hypothetical protein